MPLVTLHIIVAGYPTVRKNQGRLFVTRQQARKMASFGVNQVAELRSNFGVGETRMSITYVIINAEQSFTILHLCFDIL